MLVKDPIYQQLRQALNELILKGDFPAGEKFLTERDVSARFGVSRTTANKALSSLVADGSLEFRKGVGTFVKPGMMGYDLRSLVSFTDKARSAGRMPGTQVRELRRLRVGDAPAEVGSALGLEPEMRLFFVVRLRLADALPVILERRYIVADLCPGLTKRDLEGSLYAAWTDKFGLAVTEADQTIRAVTLSAKDSILLQVPRRAAGLEVRAVGYAGGGKPLWWEETLYRADVYEFHSRLGGQSPVQPACGHLMAGKSFLKE